MFFLHMYLKGLLILVVPVTFRTFQSFARVSTVDASERSSGTSESTGG